MADGGQCVTIAGEYRMHGEYNKFDIVSSQYCKWTGKREYFGKQLVDNVVCGRLNTENETK